MGNKSWNAIVLVSGQHYCHLLRMKEPLVAACSFEAV
jgi:hypothetical protein